MNLDEANALNDYISFTETLLDLSRMASLRLEYRSGRCTLIQSLASCQGFFLPFIDLARFIAARHQG